MLLSGTFFITIPWTMVLYTQHPALDLALVVKAMLRFNVVGLLGPG
jgi:hypothetical protein